MQFQRHTIGIGLAALLVVVALGAAAAASPAAATTGPVVASLDDPGLQGPPAHHCEGGTRIPLRDGSHICSYTPCDATCVDPDSLSGIYLR